MKYDVAVVADLCLDILLSGKVKPIYGQVEQYIDDYAIELGGSAAIFASQFTKLGGKVGLIGSVGEDTFGDILLQKLKRLHISTDHVISKPEIKTSVGVGLSYFDDRAMLTYQGSMAALSAEDILNSKVLNHSCHLHIAGYFLLDQLFNFWPDVIIELQSKGITTSLDTNWSPNNDWKKVMDLLPSINVFMPNEEEAKKISNKTDVIEAGTWLAKYCQIVVIKRGKDGATIFKDNIHFHTDVPQEISEDLKIADTTGAGDNFDAGFLREWLQGKPLKVCGMTAVKCGTLSLSEIGGIQGQLQENL